MALSRKALKAMDIEEEKIDQIIEAHTETVNGLKDEIDKYKSDSAKLASVQKELDVMKEEATKNDGKNPWKVKYDAIKEEYDSYKTEQQKKAAKTAKETAYKALLKEVGIADKRISAVTRVANLDSIELTEDGHIQNADELKDSLKEEWSDFIITETEKGANTATPPDNQKDIDYDKMSDAEYYKATYEKKG